MTRRCSYAILGSFLLCITQMPQASSQTQTGRFEVGTQFAFMQQRAFSFKDFGFGGRFTFYPVSFLAVEGETNFFPRGMDNTLTFSGSRTEALFGIKAGPRFRRFSAFGRLRPGIIHYASAAHGSVCLTILVYPPPLECRIALGSTNFALDFGGGMELYPARRGTIRVDLGDTMIRFDPANTRLGTFKQNFSIHNFQLNVGFGYRF